MVRLSIVALTLFFVSLIGLTFPPFDEVAYFSYNLLEPLGINPSFTPITVDMSMMTSRGGKNNFDNKIDVYAVTEEGKVLIPPTRMDLYLEKIPIILFLEQAQGDVDLQEARYGICRRLGLFAKSQVRAFVIETQEKVGVSKVFNKEYACDFS